jgi:hypothetical protein
MDRRGLLIGTAALGATSLLPARVLAQAKTLVAATFPGTWNEAHRNILAPIRSRGCRPPKAPARHSTWRSSIPPRCSTLHASA